MGIKGKNEQQIAAGLGISHHTVSARRNELEQGGQIAHLDKSVGPDVKYYPRQRKPVTIFNPSKREEHRNNLETPMAQKPAEEKRPAEKLKKIH